MDSGFRPPPPKMPPSTRKAIAILLGVATAGLAVRWFPSPSGWILLVVIIYVGIPLAVMVLNYIVKLRMNRMLARRVELFPPTPDEPSGMIKIEFAPLAMEYVARWRRWSPWLLVMLAATVTAGFAGRTWFPLVVVLLLVALGCEFFLAANVLEWMVPAAWILLSRPEQVRLRVCVVLMGMVNGTIAFGFAGVIVFLFFISGEPWTWRIFAFTLVYGSLVWPCGKASFRFLRRAMRRIPCDDPDAARFV